jgi:steroid 5-alpha reductase family enzyme
MPDLPALLPLALRGLALIALLAACTWVASLVRRDVSLVDRMWSLMIAGAALVYAAQAPAPMPRAIAVQLLVLAWGLRLAAYITWRNWGHGEDRRYQQIRARNQPHFALKSLVIVFALQMVLAWIVSAPTLATVVGRRGLGMLDVAGIAVALVGFLFEAIGDAQMAAFKRAAANRDRVMDRGLWRFTRHPNYFGEACFWWGLWLIALAAGGLAAAWTVVSPLLMTVLLLKVSGVAMLEKDIGERRPAYRDYIARTNAFIPWRPRRLPRGLASPSPPPRSRP